jgi:hypothetical protein
VGEGGSAAKIILRKFPSFVPSLLQRKILRFFGEIMIDKKMDLVLNAGTCLSHPQVIEPSFGGGAEWVTQWI